MIFITVALRCFEPILSEFEVKNFHKFAFVSRHDTAIHDYTQHERYDQFLQTNFLS